MKIAVLISGNIRTWDKSNLLDFIDLEVDYFISTTNKKYNYHPFISNKFGYGDFNNEIITNDDIEMLFSTLDYIKLLISDDDIIDDRKFDINMRNIDSCYHQYNRISKILDYVKNNEEASGFNYDIIVKTRFDMYYYGKLSYHISKIDIHKNVIYDIGNDTTVITSRTNFYNIIDYIISEFYHQSDKKSHIQPPHGIINSAVDNLNLTNISKKISNIIRL